MSNELGPLPEQFGFVHDGLPDGELAFKRRELDGFAALVFSQMSVFTYSQMEAERQRCYELGVTQERERVKAKLRARHAESAHFHNYYACMCVELFGEFDGT